jgi:hypothetical protein
MKKVLSAVVLSAAVVATAGQAYAFGDNFLTQTIYGSYMDTIIDDSTGLPEQVVKYAEIGVEHGYNLNLSQTNVALNQVNYNTLFSNIVSHEWDETLQALVNVNAVVTGLKTEYWIDDVFNANSNPKNFYFMTTAPLEDLTRVPSANKFTPTNLATGYVHTFYNGKDNTTPGITIGIGDVEEQNNSYTMRMNVANTSTGTYGGINLEYWDIGALSIDEMEGDVAELYLWHVNYTYDGVNPSVVSYIGNQDLGTDYAAKISFNKSTGASVLNPVPVPAAAWLLGSGVLGLFGLRRRK